MNNNNSSNNNSSNNNNGIRIQLTSMYDPEEELM